MTSQTNISIPIISSHGDDLLDWNASDEDLLKGEDFFSDLPLDVTSAELDLFTELLASEVDSSEGSTLISSSERTLLTPKLGIIHDDFFRHNRRLSTSNNKRFRDTSVWDDGDNRNMSRDEFVMTDPIYSVHSKRSPSPIRSRRIYFDSDDDSMFYNTLCTDLSSDITEDADEIFRAVSPEHTSLSSSSSFSSLTLDMKDGNLSHDQDSSMNHHHRPNDLELKEKFCTTMRKLVGSIQRTDQTRDFIKRQRLINVSNHKVSSSSYRKHKGDYENHPTALSSNDGKNNFFHTERCHQYEKIRKNLIQELMKSTK